MANARTDWTQYSNVTFAQHDILKRDTMPHIMRDNIPFDYVVDSGLFHGLSDSDRLIFISNLKELLKPIGGVYVQLAWCEKETEIRSKGVRKVSRIELESIFCVANGWAIDGIHDVVLDTIPEILNGAAKAYLSVMRRV